MDPSVPAPGTASSSENVGKELGGVGDLGPAEGLEGMKGLEPVVPSEDHLIEISVKQCPDQLTLAPAYQGTETTASVLPNHNQLQSIHIHSLSVAEDATCENDEENRASIPERACTVHVSDSTHAAFDLDLNSLDSFSVASQNSVCPYKTLDHVRSVDLSECGSTTTPLEEKGSLKIWKQLKQTGFLSTLNENLPPPKPCSRLYKRKKDDELNKKVELPKKEQVRRFNKTAAPSGLLSGLNPGIINHVRNSKQVHSIIEAMVGSEKFEEQSHNQSICEVSSSVVKSLPQFLKSERKCPVSGLNLVEVKVSSENIDASHSPSRHGNVLDLPSAEDMPSGSISSLSLKGANVASQWLELLYRDIKGRLAALKRSRKRLKNVIHTELPSLISEHLANEENNSHLRGSLNVNFSKDSTSNMHASRWKTIFCRMDKALSDEGRHLENSLEQVHEMRLHCGNALNQADADSMPLFGSSDHSRFKSTEHSERECDVRAAAAAIYSTCTFAMTKDNAPFF